MPGGLHRRHGRVGHVFQGRFNSRLIQDDRDLLAVSRYVHLNPVRAKLVDAAGAFAWSSYGAYQEEARNILGLVDVDTTLDVVSASGGNRRWAYQVFVEEEKQTISDTVLAGDGI